MEGFGADRIRILREPLGARRRRPRHPGRLGRGRQLRRVGPDERPRDDELQRRRPPGAGRGLQGLLGRSRPGRRRLLDGRPGLGDRPGDRRRRRRPQRRRRRPVLDRHRRARTARRGRGRHRGDRRRGQRRSLGLRRRTPPPGSPRSAPPAAAPCAAGSRSPAVLTFTGASRSRRHVGPVRLVLGADVAADRRLDRGRAPVPSGFPGCSARSPGVRSCACAAASVASTSPRPSPRPTGSRWCWSTTAPVAVIDDFHTVPTVQLTARTGTRPRALDAPPRPHDRAHRRRRRRVATAARSRRLVGAGRRPLDACSSPTSWHSARGSSAPYPTRGRSSPGPRPPVLASAAWPPLLRAEHHDWSASVVRSVLTTTAPTAGRHLDARRRVRVGSTCPCPGPGLALDIAPTPLSRRPRRRCPGTTSTSPRS